MEKQKQQRRTSTFFDFCKAEKGILLCTDVAARGLDIPAVVDDKYQYSTEDKDNRVHGWICFDPPVGFWQITPSNEFRTGGPFKQDLTSHVNPTTLAILVTSHYAGPDLIVKFEPGDIWKKGVPVDPVVAPSNPLHRQQVEDSLSSHPTVRPMSHQQQSHAFSSQEGCDVSVKELDSLLILLEEKKRKIEQEEAETNMQILLDFLHCLRKQKLEELNEIQTDLQYIKEDINAVERHRIDLYRAKERYSVKLRMLLDDPSATKAWPSLMDRRRCVILSSIPPSPQGQCWMNEGNSQSRKVDGKALISSQMVQRKDFYSGSDSHVTQSGLAVARKRRVHAQFNDLQECYLQRRRHWVRQSYKQEERDTNAMNREGYHAGLEDFQSVLSTFTRYSEAMSLLDANPTRIVPLSISMDQNRESCSSVNSEEFELEALVDSGVAHRQGNSEVKTGLEEVHRGWFNSGVDSLEDCGIEEFLLNEEVHSPTCGVKYLNKILLNSNQEDLDVTGVGLHWVLCEC
ncbi:hypothetical protein TEA_016494 [Camellia sinensis var. sinensis]|uniref:Helicase C-terminal domain-containing protein n=1 Tax=Camellia sinensis var. sinensis TaxID=542762 RepID=A0A4S4E6D1_CAMSN|nr:hypothetical protein TEA_016494 [Camellia sinensis var. sinensis]